MFGSDYSLKEFAAVVYIALNSLIYFLALANRALEVFIEWRCKRKEQ